MGGREPRRGRPACGDPDRRRGRGAFLALVLGGLCADLHGAPPAAAETFFFRDRAGVMHFTNVPTDKRYKVLRTAKSSFSQIVLKPGARYGDGRAIDLGGTRRARAERHIAPPPELARLINDAASRYGVDPALVHAVVRAESAFDHLAVSRAGAMGLMQLMPGTAELVGVRDAFHPQQNVEGGVYYLRKMLDRFGHNVALALAAYNAGPGAVENYGGIPPYRETQDYLERVFRFRQEYLRKAIEDRVALAKPAVR